MKIGDREFIKRTFSDEDVKAFAILSGDSNPIHLDDEYAKNTLFGKKIVHGLLVSSLISAILGVKLPGLGTIYLAQNLSFLKPVFIDEEVMAEVIVESQKAGKPIFTLSTKCYKGNGELCIDGTATVMI